MTDSPQAATREGFFEVVLPALKAAGYTGQGSGQRLAEATGMSPGTVSRLARGKTIPAVESIPPLAKAIGLDPIDLLIRAHYLPADIREQQQPLSETERSQVGSEGITPEEAADKLGFHDEVRRSIFFGLIQTLKDARPDDSTESPGDAAAEM
ncbi:helix-turn-helix domain-containing protein [Streptomyces sp. NPDC088789]|uniref:helix-turn-helix domain-containing protein n=1 Tax=Streptomyces sp. NPDC088789 TaxID=3365899 RepID=UPI0037FD7D9B